MNDPNELLKFPIIHPSIAHQNNGIYAKDHILQGTIIMQTPTSNTLFEEHPKITEFGVKDCGLLFCLIWLKKNTPPADEAKHQWIHSPTSGYVSFGHELIKGSNDEDLFIEYVAYKNKLKHEAESAFLSHGQQIAQLLEIDTLEQFTQEYIWASEFRNTRAFGFTAQTLMIPFIDYMNYDPTKTVKTRFVHFNALEEISLEQSAGQSMDGIESSEQSESDEEEGLESVRKHVGIVTTEDIEKGEEIMFRYGSLSNRYLLQWYGYACENNPFDKVTVYLKNHPSTDLISFSQVERGTTAFVIRRGKVNAKLIAHWEKVTHSPIGGLIAAMKKAQLPRISEKLKAEPHYEWIELYQKEQAAIYECHLQLLEAVGSQL